MLVALADPDPPARWWRWAGVALLHNTILPNFGTMMRWRAHRHVLRQPVGWFESDFAGRIANRIMQTPPAAGDAVFQIFDTMAFAAVTVIGARIMLADADPRLLLPLLIWFVALRRADALDDPPRRARRQGLVRCPLGGDGAGGRCLYQHPFGQAFRPSRQRTELRQGGDRERRARPSRREMRIVTKMDLALTLLNGLLIVSVTGWAMWLWYQGAATVGTVAAAVGAGPAAEQHDLLDHVGLDQPGAEPWHAVHEGMETITQPDHAGRRTRRQAAGLQRRADRD